MLGRLKEKGQPLFAWEQGGDGDPTYYFLLKQSTLKKKLFIEFVNLCKIRDKTDLFNINIKFTDFIKEHMEIFKDWLESERSEIAKKRKKLFKRGGTNEEIDGFAFSAQNIINRDVHSASFQEFIAEFMSVLHERMDGKLDKESIRFERGYNGSVLSIRLPGAIAMEMLATIHQFYPFDLAAQKTIVGYLLPSVEVKNSHAEGNQCRDVTSFFSAPVVPQSSSDDAATIKNTYSIQRGRGF